MDRPLIQLSEPRILDDEPMVFFTIDQQTRQTGTMRNSCRSDIRIPVETPSGGRNCDERNQTDIRMGQSEFVLSAKPILIIIIIPGPTSINFLAYIPIPVVIVTC
jgi:hypothetical protein